MNPAELFSQVVERARRATWWQMLLVGVAAAFVLPLVLSVVVMVVTSMPLVIMVLAIAVALVMFARAWVREFAYLMRLGDEMFPGRNDKLIWAMTLVFLPPIGAWLFRAHPEVHWPEPKPKPGRADAFDVL